MTEMTNRNVGSLAVAVSQCDEATAQALTLALRQSLTVSCDLLVEAYERRAWAVLGYESWRDYTDAELGEVRLRLPREQRRELVATMTEAGMSTRAIGAALGVSDETARRDRGATFVAPEPEPMHSLEDVADEFGVDLDEPDDLADKIAAELAASDEQYAEQAKTPDPEPERPRVTGTDGKTYPATKPPQPDPAVTEWLNDSQAVQDSGYLREFTRTFARADDFLRFNAERLGSLIDQGEFESLELFDVSVGRFVDTVRRSRTGLRVINGGN